ncbi:MAG: AMIN domain-containing protein [Candidatus Eisenbacteria sp.]|nr:AMIN domain-containing protein [Candidatus Eisenbacteria bacterium]
MTLLRADRGGQKSGLAVGLGLLWFLSISAEATPLSKEISEVRIAQDTRQWLMEVPYNGRWSHWSINHPPRIVVDLIGARSQLPKAPALYSVDLPGGPVTQMRTSQFSSEPGKWRVRITLVLSESVRYEAEQTQQGVELRISQPDDAQWGGLWRMVIDPQGMRAEAIHSSLPEGDSTATSHPAVSREKAPAPEVKPASSPARREPDVPAGPAWIDSTGEATLEELLADTLFFVRGRRPSHLAWDLAAGRLLENAQDRFLMDDSAGCISKLETCTRFYATTDPGRQATLLRHLILRAWGRVVEADLGPEPPQEGPWLLLADQVFQRLLDSSLYAGDLGFTEDVLSLWQQANPEPSDWGAGSLRLAEAYLDGGEGQKAAGWITRALEADPELEASPGVILLHALTRLEVRAWDEAAALLLRVEASGEGALAFRARALRADAYYRQEKFKRAAEIYQQLLGQGIPPVEREWAIYQLGNCWAEMGDVEKARAYFSRAVEGSEGCFWAPFAQLRLVQLEGDRHAASIR